MKLRNHAFGAAVSSVLFIATLWHVWPLWQAHSTNDWPNTQGTILNSFLTEREDTDADDNAMTYYSPTVEYKYVVGETEYQSRRVAWNKLETSSDDNAQALQKKFPTAGTVTVYYDPQDPSQSVIIRGISRFDTEYVTAAVWGYFALLTGIVTIFEIAAAQGFLSSGLSHKLTGPVSGFLIVTVFFVYFWYQPSSRDDPPAKSVSTSTPGSVESSDAERQASYDEYIQKVRAEQRRLAGTTWRRTIEALELETTIRFENNGTGIISRTQPRRYRLRGIDYQPDQELREHLKITLDDGNGKRVIRVEFKYQISDSHEQIRMIFPDESFLQAGLFFRGGKESVEFYKIKTNGGIPEFFGRTIESFPNFERTANNN